MNEISLTSYKTTPGNETTIEGINALPLPDGRPAPKGLFTAFYGARDPLIGLCDARLKAQQAGQVVKTVILKVQAGENTTSTVTTASAANAVFINVERIDASLEAELINYVAPGKDGSLASIIDDNPELLNRLFSCPELPSVNMIVWPASFKKGAMLKMAAVRDLTKIRVANVPSYTVIRNDNQCEAKTLKISY
ncbi:hypothetical protein IVG45_17135 [Methylomonas sp. LL1]|uniref:hypothetical protein n=1 Tax=Methylomonas sp. LL1 TaxID=2785785 RepID=UPI0018C44A63|nr:hypothetical protein [Methylomonas sp. LL1]QPK62558.1 hypothetical protein IVG45_17135 [Methylomonas sp. LL1]